MPSHFFSFIHPSVHPSISPSVHLVKSSIYPSEPIQSIRANPVHPSQSSPSEPIQSIRANPVHLSQSIHPPKSLHLSPVYPSVCLSLYPISSFFSVNFMSI